MDNLVTEVFERFGCWAAGSPDDLDTTSVHSKECQADPTGVEAGDDLGRMSGSRNPPTKSPEDSRSC